MARRIPQLVKSTPNSASAASSRTHVYSATKSEEFRDYLTSLGHLPSRQQKSELFDYLFNDPETSKFMDTLTASVKPTNYVSDAEIMRIKKLEDEGNILLGEDLRIQVSNAKRIEAEVEEEQKIESLQEAELRRKIEEKISSIKELERLNAMIDDTIKRGKKENSMRAFLQASHPTVDSAAHVEVKLFTQHEVVSNILESLSRKLQTVFQKYETEGDDEKFAHRGLSAVLNWNEIIEEEDELIELCLRIAQKCGTQLMNETGDVDEPVLIEEIRQSFEQYAKDIERLKHVIIFESVKKLKLKATATTYTNTSAAPRIKAVMEELKRVNTLEPRYQKVLTSERMEVQKGLKEKLKVMKIRRANEFRNALALRFSQDIRRLTELKAGGTSQVTELLSFLLEIVGHQISRVFILRQMAQPEDRRTELFSNEAESIFTDIKKLTEIQDSHNPNILAIQDRFSANEKELAQYLSKFDIPLSVMISYQSTWDSLAWIRDEEIEKTKTSLASCKAQEMEARILDVAGKETLMSNLWKSIKTERLDKNSQNTTILLLEKIQDEMRTKLSWYLENKSKITKNAVEKKAGLIQEMKAELLIIKKDKENRERMDSSF